MEDFQYIFYNSVFLVPFSSTGSFSVQHSDFYDVFTLIFLAMVQQLQIYAHLAKINSDTQTSAVQSFCIAGYFKIFYEAEGYIHFSKHKGKK